MSLISDEEIERRFRDNFQDDGYVPRWFFDAVVDRLRSAEEALRFYAEDKETQTEVWERDTLIERGEKARAHFERLKPND